MEINILISTIDKKIQQVKDVILDPRDDVKYIISHQYTRERFKYIPSELVRKDIRVSQIEGKGVTKSRNNALRLATGDIGLFSDDDVTYRDEYIDIVKETFLSNHDIDIALFKIKTGKGEQEYKNYPKIQVKLKKKLFSVSTIEIGFKIDSVKQAGLFFDERFGVGEELLVGSEETIFIEDCIKHGLNVVYIPEYIVEHPYNSTVNTIPKFDKRMNWVVGAYDCRTNGSIALLKAFGGTLKLLPELIEHKVNPFVYLYHRLSAVIYILFTNKKGG